MKSSAIDVVLVNPGSPRRTYQGLATRLTAVEPPVWAGLLAAGARAAGLSVAVIDANAEQLLPLEVAERVNELKPRLTVVVVFGHQPSASTQNMPAAGAVCEAIKARDAEQRVLLVGGHVAALPERTLREETADFVCDGEGLTTICELAQALECAAPRLESVRGLWYLDDGLPRRTAPAPLVSDLDGQLPDVAWDLLPMSRYRAHNWHCFGGKARQPYASLYTSLGCPFSCRFCCIQAPFRHAASALEGRRRPSYRRWQPQTVLRSIDALADQYGVRNIKFGDELFVANRKHVDAICEGIVRRDYDLNIWAYARVDTVDRALAAKLRAAGVTWLALGIESASERVRADANKGYAQQRLYDAVSLIKEAGIHIIGNYIFGLPEDNLATMQETLDLALELNCEFANFYCAMAYPGSELYSDALRNGWQLPGTWNGYSQHAVDTLPLPTRHVSAGEVLRFRDNAFHTYFSNPRYLDSITQTFGVETRRAVEKMAERRLERTFAAP